MRRRDRIGAAVGGVALGLALLGEVGPARAQGGEPFGFLLQAGRARWSYDDRRGANEVAQDLLSGDALWSPRSNLRLQLGLDLVGGSRSGQGFEAEPDRRSALRGAAGITGWDGRAGLRLGIESWLSPDLATLEEVALAEGLEQYLFEFSRPRPGQGAVFGVTGAVQLVRRAHWSAQVGLGFERRGAYALGPDGPEFDPGDRVRLGAGGRLAGGRGDLRLSVDRASTGDEQLAGGDAYRSGAQTQVRLELATPRSTYGAQAALAWTARSGGSIADQTVLDPMAVRSGNRLRWRVAGTREYRDWGLRLGAGGSHLRGFSGLLGHADWVGPEAGVVRRFRASSVELAARAPFGSSREGESLDGLSLELRYGWGLLR
ncbi:MAG: hypothetical protein IPK72_05890 [Candidatus Eisenbacteria bacterium]|nr:hypothetical protein [Candidatus Eisenbacteria bacterium]